MNDFIQIIETIGADPRAWLVLGLFALRAVYSIVIYFRCPLCWSAKLVADPEEAQRRINSKSGGSMRFFLLMVTGIVLAVVGLFMLADGVKPTIALFLMVLGAFLFMTEPIRLRINDARLRVISAGENEDQRMFHVGGLKSQHKDLLKLEIGIPVALGVALVVAS